MKRCCWIGILVWLVMAACARPDNDPVETRFIASLTNIVSPELSAIDSLMWHQPDSALACLIPYFDTCCRDAKFCVSTTTTFNRHYANLLLSELLYKNDYAQTNRPTLLQAVHYFDSLVREAPPFKGGGGIKKDNPTPIHKPINKKALWIGLGIAAAVAVALFFVLTRLDSVKTVDVTGSANGHYYVDLGLPSGTLWATCNIGANNPEDYGNYYAWGETKPQPGTTYNWSSYKYAKGNNDKLTKYCNKSDYGNNGFTDYLPALQSIDDPSVANWGNGWRTPSKSQWDELFANTTNKWATKNGVKGRLFTSKKNGKSFFLPSAGNRRDSELSYDGSYGYYWTCSLNSDYPYGAWNIYFNSDYCRVNYDNRSRGFSVRPVREK